MKRSSKRSWRRSYSGIRSCNCFRYDDCSKPKVTIGDCAQGYAYSESEGGGAFWSRERYSSCSRGWTPPVPCHRRFSHVELASLCDDTSWSAAQDAPKVIYAAVSVSNRTNLGAQRSSQACGDETHARVVRLAEFMCNEFIAERESYPPIPESLLETRRKHVKNAPALIPTALHDAIQPKAQGVVRGYLPQNGRGSTSQQRAVGVLRRQDVG
eukprot:4377505-Pleurochrysis_carterae.AAC.2